MPSESAVTQTAFGPIFIVAVEQFTPASSRLVDDAMARQFLPFIARVTLAACRPRLVRQQLVRWSDQRLPGLWGSLLCRKRYADDQFALALRQGIRQVVSLGAGLDTRAYRHLAEPRSRTFEVDLPSNSLYKQRRLRSMFGRVPEHVVLVPLDFESEDLTGSLVARGYDSDQPTLFVWEAVTQYLTQSAVRRTLASLSRAARGSRLLFTYVQQDFIDGTNLFDLQALHKQFVGKQPLWHFGLHPADVSPFLSEFGWSEREQVGASEYQRRYVTPLGRDMRVTDVERFVLAEKT